MHQRRFLVIITMAALTVGFGLYDYEAIYKPAHSLAVDFTANKQCFFGLCNVTFTPYVSGGNQPYSYYWTFGDGYSSAQQSPTHTYPSQVTVTVTLSVASGNLGGTASKAFVFG
jgi:PKD repeat protein